MPTHAAVLRVEPVKMTSLAGRAAHNNRSERPSFRSDGRPHVDANRAALNQVLHGSGNAIKDVEAILEKYQMASKRSKNVAAELIITANKEYFDSISPDWRKGKYTIEFEQWIKQSKAFLEAEFGEGVASIDLHMDETAPHIHAIVVPVCTYEQGYRHGSKEVTKVHYNRVFGDDAKVIQQAREAENPELTKLGKLQTKYAKSVENLGLKRGLMYSNANNRTLETYRKLVLAPPERPLAPRRPSLTESASERAMKLVGVPSSKDKALTEYRQRMEIFRKQKEQYTKGLEAQQKHLQIVSERNSELEDAIARKQEKLLKAESDIKKITNELSLSKAELNHLRSYDLKAVAKALSYEGEITWKGAIDMVKDVGGLDYKDAVVFLFDNFGVDGAKRAVMQQHVTDGIRASANVSADAFKTASRRLSKSEYAIRCEFEKQIDCLDAASYRVTLMSDTKPTYTLNKQSDGSEVLYTKAQLLSDSIVSMLNYKNWHDEYNIFVTPVDDTKHYILVDDLSSETYSHMLSDGYTPTLTLESSHGNYQSVIVVSKDECGKDDTNAFFKEINAAYGDANILGLSHPFRAVGFKNAKPKHIDPESGRRPIVKLLQVAQGICSMATQRIRDIAAMTHGMAAMKAGIRDVNKAFSSITKREIEGVSGAEMTKLSRYCSSFYSAMKHKYGEQIDLSRADFMLVQRLQSAGHDAPTCARALLEFSPDIAKRHPNLSRYVDATVNAPSM